jgi:hypothetical protein
VRLLLEIVIPLLIGNTVQEGVSHVAEHLFVILYFDLAKWLNLFLYIFADTPRILSLSGLFGPFGPSFDDCSWHLVNIRHGLWIFLLQLSHFALDKASVSMRSAFY